MFNLAIKPMYWWPVTVSIQLDGEWHEENFSVQFKRYSRDELGEVLRANTEAETKQGREQDRDTALLRDAIKGWRDLVSEKESVEFSQSALDALLAITPARVALVSALLESQARAREKN